MKTIETTATVSPEGTLFMRIPPSILPGEHRVVIVIDEEPANRRKKTALKFPVDHYGPWPGNLCLRREEMYGDNGR